MIDDTMMTNQHQQINTSTVTTKMSSVKTKRKSSWVWMKDKDEALTSVPINPIDAHDTRPLVADLLEQHAVAIETIRCGIVHHSTYENTKHDDVWILRFLLSHKGRTSAAIQAALHTLDFRATYHLDDVDVRHTPPHKIQSGLVYEYMKHWNSKNTDGMRIVQPDPKRGVVGYLKFSRMNQQQLLKTIRTTDDLFYVYMILSEWTFQNLDYVTRTTGRLTKSIRCIDASGLTLRKIDVECCRRDGIVMNRMEDCYPQLLDCIFVANAPTIISVVWNVLKHILPKRVVTKFHILTTSSNNTKNANSSSLLYQYVSPKQLPISYGGYS